MRKKSVFEGKNEIFFLPPFFFFRRRKKHQKVGLAHDRGELSPEPMMITKEEEKPLFFSPFFEFIDDHHHDLCPGISDTATVVQNAQRIADSDGVVKRKYIAEKSKSGSRVIGVLQAGKLFFSFCERVLFFYLFLFIDKIFIDEG